MTRWPPHSLQETHGNRKFLLILEEWISSIVYLKRISVFHLFWRKDPGGLWGHLILWEFHQLEQYCAMCTNSLSWPGMLQPMLPAAKSMFVPYNHKTLAVGCYLRFCSTWKLLGYWPPWFGSLNSQNLILLLTHDILCLHECSVTAVVLDSFAAPWTVACQAPPSLGFSEQEYWRG